MPTITNNTTAYYGIPLPSPSNRLVDDLSRITGALTSIDALLAAKLDLTAYTEGGGTSPLLDENNHINYAFMPHMYGDATSVAGTAELTLSATGVAAGTYKSVTVDAKGRVTAATNPNTVDDYGILDAVKTSRLGVNGGVATLNSNGTLTATQIPSFTGDVTGSGTTLTLADSGVTAGSYNTVTVDAKGRVTAGSNIAGVASGLATLNSSSLLTTSQMPALTGDITSTAGTVATSLSTTGVSAGTYNTVTVDVKGRVTSGTNVSTSNGGLTPTSVQTTNYTASVNDMVRCDSTSSSFNITLPSSPVDGAQIGVIDITKKFGTKPVTIVPGSGNTIDNSSSLMLSSTGTYVSFVYTASLSNWSLLNSSTNSTSSAVLTPTTVKTSNYQTSDYEIVRCNTSGGAFSVTMPSSPVDGSIIGFVDINNTFATNNLTILPNTGKTIEGDITSYVLDMSSIYVSFIYTSATSNWRLLETPTASPTASIGKSIAMSIAFGG